MHYNEYKNTYIDTNECTSRGVCSIAPSIASLQELIMVFLKQSAYYILKLEKLGANNNAIKFDVINDIASLVSINEFSEKQLFSIAIKDYFLLNNAKNTYRGICTEKEICPGELKTNIKFDESTPIAKAISQGEKLFLEKYKRLTAVQKNLTEILLIIVKSICINLVKLSDFKQFDDEISQEILNTLDMFNHGKNQNKKITDQITKLAQLDNKLQLKISELLLNEFGEISQVEVSHSTRKGKAILVSGNNFFDLLKILEETKDKDIDVYTHSNLLITHALKKFQNFENLRGHYGDTTESCILDFATFPGSILLTKNSRNNTEYLYRGRLFSNDYIIHQGVIKIEDDDYTPLIDSALNAKGFSKGKLKEPSFVGYNEEEIDKQIEQIVKKLENKEITQLYIVGMNAYSEIQKAYFNDLFSKLKPDEFVISFSYDSPKDNVLTINVGNYTPLATNIMHKLFNKYPISSENIVFFFTTCEVMTISNIVMLKSLDAKNIYMATCPPTLVNPSVFDTFRTEYKINVTSSADKDITNIRQNKSTQ